MNKTGTVAMNRDIEIAMFQTDIKFPLACKAHNCSPGSSAPNRDALEDPPGGCPYQPYNTLTAFCPMIYSGSPRHMFP
jgi:hypothetical protein